MTKALEVYHLETGQVVRSIDVTGKSERHIDRAMSGMEINMSPEYDVRLVTED